ncbi:MAG: ribonuclease H-like domain-containing protein [Leptospiraceae bacterium]|nr:ribonuclease H-like domain-containing protein [Leptospiraceae bacterium]
MIETSFLHLKGIGQKKLNLLREKGIQTWEDALLKPELLPFKSEKKNLIINEIMESKSALDNEDIHFLSKKLHKTERWKVLDKFFNRISYFDIETDGYTNRITLICCLHKGRVYKFLREDNLDMFLEILDDMELAVSFNGASFDVPVILYNFHIPEFPVPHIDLRWVLYFLGIKGGLKSIEKRLEIQRPNDLEGVDGFFAIELWNRWKQFGDREALLMLERYCASDVISLFYITAKVIEIQTGKKLELDDYWNTI